jgi:hypothetical protein
MAISRQRRSATTPTPSSSFEAADRDLIELAQRIGEEARTGRVSFFGNKQADGDIAWSVIFQDGPRRATIGLRSRPSEADIEDIAMGLRSWANYRADGAVYTTEVPTPLPSEWS